MSLSNSFAEPLARDEQVTARLTGPQLAALDGYAARHGLTRAQAIRQAIGVALVHEQNDRGHGPNPS